MSSLNSKAVEAPPTGDGYELAYRTNLMSFVNIQIDYLLNDVRASQKNVENIRHVKKCIKMSYFDKANFQQAIGINCPCGKSTTSYGNKVEKRPLLLP